MSGKNRKSLEGLVKELVDMLQRQVLSFAKLHGIERGWSDRFLSLFSHMQTVEHLNPKEPKYTFICKDLFDHLNHSKLSLSTSRSRPPTHELPKQRYISAQRPNNLYFAPSHKKSSSSSTYYSRIMSKFLTQPKSTKAPKRMKRNQDIWVLGDEITLLP